MADLFNLIFVFIEFKTQISLEGVKCSYEWLFFEVPGKNFKDHVFSYFDKNHLLYYMNILNFIKYLCYSNIKRIMLRIYFYIIQIFLILVYNNMPNMFVQNYLCYYYILKQSILYYKKYIMLGYIKKWRFWRNYYRFYHIDYLKILFFFFLVILFILMWKRRNTYLKRFFIWNLLLFYIFSIIISFLLWPLFINKCLSICVSLLISFFIIFLKLN